MARDDCVLDCALFYPRFYLRLHCQKPHYLVWQRRILRSDDEGSEREIYGLIVKIIKMRNLITTIYVLFALSSWAQIDTTKWEFLTIQEGDTIYARKPSKADKAREIGDYDTAINEFYKLISQEPEVNDHIYNLACIFSVINQKDSAFKYLRSAIEADSTAYPVTDPDFFNLISDKRWNEIVENQIKKIIRSSKFQYKDTSVVKQLWRMKLTDQALYSQIDVYEKTLGINNPKSDSLWKIKEKLNKTNVKQLEQIISKYGWPRATDFGGVGVGAAFLIIQHSNLELQKKYLPLLEEAAKNKEANWEEVALMTDRILTAENKPQIYGSQVTYNEKTKKYELFPIKDPQYVDKRRAEKGMMPLKDYVSNWGIKFDVLQKK